MGIIRLILAVSVVIAHTTPLLNNTLVGGPGAVKLFYIISGFYMALVLNEKYAGTKSAYRVFLTARVTRLMPVYYVVLLASIVLSLGWNEAVLQSGATSGWRALDGHPMNPVSALFLVATNMLLVGQDAAMFMAYHVPTGSLHFTPRFFDEPFPAARFLFVPQAWSLGTELLFYIVAPLLVRRKALLWATVGFSLAVKFYLNSQGLNFDPWSYRFFPAEVGIFAAGSLGYHFYAYLRERQVFDTRWSHPLAWATVAGFVWFGFLPLGRQEQLQPLLFVAFAVLVPLIFMGTKDSKWDRYIGELSYPMYVVHAFIVTALFHLNGPPTARIVVPLTIVGGALLWWLVDLPCERLRRRLIIRQLATKQAAAVPAPVRRPR